MDKYHLNDVSVIVTRYKEGFYEYSKCIKSILDCGIDPAKLFLVNDNPYDYINNFLEINIFNNIKNVGVSASRNLALSKVETALVCFCDADDEWLPHKISKQLKYFNCLEEIDLVSTGMREVYLHCEMIRIPFLSELKYGGNPLYLSSLMVRKKAILDDFKAVKAEDKIFINQFNISNIKIIKEPLIVKYNHHERRGKAGLENTIKIYSNFFQAVASIWLKIISIKKINFYLLRLIIANLGIKSNTKRLFLSLNFISAEYINLKKFAHRYNDKLVLNNIVLSNPSEYRRPALLRANGIKAYISALIIDSVNRRHNNWLYIGLPGANIIREVIEGVDNKSKLVHVAHGMPNSDKFMVYTRGAIISNSSIQLNCKKIIFDKYPNFRIYKSYTIRKVWIHGYEKGRYYGILNLMKDLKIIFAKDLFVVAHPTAYLLKLFLAFFQKRRVVSSNEILASAIFNSSPSSHSVLLNYCQQIDIEYIKLR